MQKSARASRIRYQERLTPSLWGLVALAVAGPMVALTFVPINPTLGLILGIVTVLGVGVLAIAGSPTLVVTDSEFIAGRARIDVRYLAHPVAHAAEEARQARGPGLPAHGFHLLRPSIDGIVVVAVTDPADPAPSWTVASRTPERLVAVLQRAIAERAPGA